jgi:hypothetical protein
VPVITLSLISHHSKRRGAWVGREGSDVGDPLLLLLSVVLSKGDHPATRVLRDVVLARRHLGRRSLVKTRVVPVETQAKALVSEREREVIGVRRGAVHAEHT